MEVPTGSVADIWGRKTSRLAGRVCYALSLVLMYWGPTFWLQILAFVLSALGYNLESGAGDALLYDSLLLDADESRYLSVKGRDELLYNVASIIAFLIGGYLASVDYMLAFGLTILSSLVGFAIALFFREPVIHEEMRKEERPNLVKSIAHSLKNQMVDSMKVFASTPRIAFLIIFSESLFAFMICLFFYLQNHWTNLGYTPDYIGLIFSLHALVAALFSVNAHRIERAIGQKGILIVCPILLLFTLWTVALTPYSALFYILNGSLEGLLAPTISTYLNRLIPSRFRATILSFQSMAYSLFMIMIFPLVGLIGSLYSLPLAFSLMAFLATVLVVPYLVLITRNKNRRKL
jgi:MFS family permease